jgi:hypothetical protein
MWRIGGVYLRECFITWEIEVGRERSVGVIINPILFIELYESSI